MVKNRVSRKTLVLRTASPDRAAELLDECTRLGYHAIVGIEPDKPEDTSDLERARKRCRPALLAASLVPRNGPCPCGSGSKHKNCCGRP
jgi:uncharacterized protein YecA (UPF0149 family)